jgi:16S rRNA (cytidine1402-2'-O)-methyltransferase
MPSRSRPESEGTLRAVAGTLYIVGTPIGNLGDMTLRAIETLRGVHRVAAEDTRRTRALLTHLGISGKPLDVVEAHTKEAAFAALIDRLLDGQDVALVTDAGMPGISDPGARLVRRAAERGIPVRVVPGPSAVTAAAAVSGLVEGAFWFVGFLPRRGTRRERMIQRIAASEDPVVVFESPLRASTTLADLARAMPQRAASVSRELTKLHEETAYGALESLCSERRWRGEICIVLGPLSAGTARGFQPDDEQIQSWIAQGVEEGASTKTLLSRLGPRTGLARRELYARIEAARGHRRE